MLLLPIIVDNLISFYIILVLIVTSKKKYQDLPKDIMKGKFPLKKRILRGNTNFFYN